MADDMPITTKITSYVIITLFSLMCLFPLLITMSISLTDELTLSQYGYSLLPRKFSLEAYSYIINNGAQIWQAFGVSATVTIVGVILGVFAMAMFSYAVTRKSFPWRNQFSFFVYFTMLFNGGLVASYIVNTTIFNLRDTIWVLILVGCMSAYNIMIMRTYMRTAIPEAVLESARIDGSGEFMLFYKFVLPMSIPVLGTIALFLTVSYWNNWNTGYMYIMTRTDLSPIMLVLKRIERDIEFLAQAESTLDSLTLEQMKQTLPTESFRMALVILSALPMLILYPFFQRFFIKGITVGSVKG